MQYHLQDRVESHHSFHFFYEINSINIFTHIFLASDLLSSLELFFFFLCRQFLWFLSVIFSIKTPVLRLLPQLQRRWIPTHFHFQTVFSKSTYTATTITACCSYY